MSIRTSLVAGAILLASWLPAQAQTVSPEDMERMLRRFGFGGATSQPTFAPTPLPGGWTSISEQGLAGRGGILTFQVPAARRDYRSIAFVTGRLRLTARRVDITFADGTSKQVRLRQQLNPGDISERISLTDDRSGVPVRTVRLRYVRAAGGRGETVQLIGLEGVERRESVTAASLLGDLASRGFTDISFLDRSPPRFRVEACQNDRRLRLVINRRGKVVDRERIGRCGPPPIPTGFDLVATGLADRSRGSDRIEVGADAGSFDAIQLRVKDADVRLNRIDVVFGNGTTQRIRARDDIGSDTLSPVYELDGEWGRNVRSVELRYRTRRGQDRSAEVDILMRSAAGRPTMSLRDMRRDLRRDGLTNIDFTDRELPGYVAEACRETERVRIRLNRFGETRGTTVIGRCGPPPIPAGWETLTTLDVERRRNTQTVRVGAGAGTFDAIQLRVAGSDVRVRSVVVTLGNGEEQTFRARSTVAKDSLSEVLKLTTPYGVALRTVAVTLRTQERGAEARVDVIARKAAARPRATAADIRRKLRRDGYDQIQLTDSTPPNFAAVACQEGERYNLAINRFGEIQTRRYTGSCRADAGGGRQNWTEVASRQVGYIIDRDTVRIETDRPVRALRVRAERAPIYLARAIARLEDGREVAFTPRQMVNEGENSVPMTFDGQGAEVRDVTFFYRSLLGQGQARVVVEANTRRGGGGQGGARPGDYREARVALRARRFTNIEFKGIRGNRISAEACRNGNRLELTLNRNGRIVDRNRIGRCDDDDNRGEQVALDLDDLRNLLRARKYYGIEFTDRRGPRYGAEACRQGRKFALTINERGRVLSRRRVGFCQARTAQDQVINAVEFDPNDVPRRGRLSAAVCQDYMEYLLNSETVNFSTGSASIGRQSYDLLERLADVANRCDNADIEIAGHTDNVGSSSSNQQLSERRAISVFNFLVDAGVSRRKMTAIGYGESQPIASNSSSSGRARNRRIEFVADWSE